MWGEPLIRPWLSEHHWNRMNFIIEAEGAILCFILYLIPGFPKDIISYLFGISPMPFWVFAVVSTIGRLPGTWISSYFGAHVGEQQYIYALHLHRAGDRGVPAALLLSRADRAPLPPQAAPRRAATRRGRRRARGPARESA